MLRISLVLLALFSSPVHALDVKDDFERLAGRWKKESRDTSPDNLRSLEGLVRSFGGLEYGEARTVRKRAEKLLMEIAANDHGPKGYGLRDAAIETLGRVAAGRRAVDFLFKLAAGRDGRNSTVPARAAVALQRLRDEQAVRHLCEKGLGHRNRAVAIAAVRAVAGLETEGARRVAREHAAAITLGLGHESARVRCHAARAVGTLRLRGLYKPLTLAARSKDLLVRLGVAEALAHLADEPHAWDELARLLRDPSLRVRERAAISVGAIGDVEACVLLIPRLRKERRRVQAAMFDALRKLSGLDQDDRVKLWEDWWRARAERKPEVAATRDAVPKERNPRYGLRYYGIPVRSDRVLFIVDISMSMRYGGAGHDPCRMDIAKKELARVIGRLKPGTRFNIMVFSTGNAYFSRRGLVEATPKARARAVEWVRRLTPAGGTNSWAALKAGFDRFPEVDTVFFLSDGKPSRGMITDPDRIVARYTELNRRRGVILHAIALVRWSPVSTSFDLDGEADDAARFMKRLAASTGGRFERHD